MFLCFFTVEFLMILKVQANSAPHPSPSSIILRPRPIRVNDWIIFRPMETQGCWYNDNFLISSNFQYLTQNVCSNKLTINKVNFTLESSHTLVNERDLYKLYNCAGNYLREINVINLPKNCKYNFYNGLESSNYDEVRFGDGMIRSGMVNRFLGKGSKKKKINGLIH